MSLKDVLLTLVVVVVWGVNFVIMKVGLHDVSPMLLGVLRFGLAATPALFIKRPQVPWRLLILYGLTISFGQFAFLFSAIYVGMPTGLASLVMQAQAFFTLLFARFVLHERLHFWNLLGLFIAAAGLALIGMQAGQTMTLSGFLLTLCAAGCWAIGNIVTKKVGKVDLVGLVVWGSLVPPLPFLLISLWFEGPQHIVDTLANISLPGILSALYLSFIATLVGYGLWSRMLSRYPASLVAPFSLLVPIIGLACASFFLDERLTPVEVVGIALVMAGLAVNIFGPRVRGMLTRKFS